MIDSDHLLAVSQYIQLEALKMTRDLALINIKTRDWEKACGQARSRTNTRILTQDEYARLGARWYPSQGYTQYSPLLIGR